MREEEGGALMHSAKETVPNAQIAANSILRMRFRAQRVERDTARVRYSPCDHHRYIKVYTKHTGYGNTDKQS